jgi:hypothetical protein
MEGYSDSDNSSESECEPDGDPAIEPDLEEVDQYYEFEPEPSIPDYNKYKTFWTPLDQLNTQIDASYLQQL